MSDRPIVDAKLEWEADHSGVIHLRRHPGETQFLEGYGTTDFGVSSYESRTLFTPVNILITTGIATAGYLGWINRDRVINLALLFRESLRT